MTAVAGCFGVLGIGMGWWWADALAAAFISIDIIGDEWKHLRGAVGDLMDRTPTDVEEKQPRHPLVDRMVRDLQKQEGCVEAQVRLRDFGLYLCGVAILHTDAADHARLYHGATELRTDYDPELHDCLVVVHPVGSAPV